MTIITAEKILEGLPIASAAAETFFQEKLGGRDRYPCGFAWTTVIGVKLSTLQGKEFAKAGFKKAYDGGIQYRSPGNMRCQNVDTHEAGAKAFAEYLTSLGFKAYGNSRLD
jgi:hypothetical protein